MANSYIPSLLFLLVSFVIFPHTVINATPPAIFIFGDSTVDVGTNNFISDCEARANFPYYGIDFANSNPTGRFSNGFNCADFLSKLMGFTRSPEPFLLHSRVGTTVLEALSKNLSQGKILENLSGLVALRSPSCGTASFIFSSNKRVAHLSAPTAPTLLLSSLRYVIQRRMFRGVNFASGGSGLFDITGKALKVVPMSKQINQFVTVRSNLMAIIGQSSTDYLLSKSIFFISSGNNDILEYFVNNSTVPKEQFINALMTAYESHIKALYDLGGRKFGIISVSPMGCCPSQRVLNATGGCLEAMNDVSVTFHSAIDTLLYKINSKLQEFKYSLGNTYEMIMNVIQNPARYSKKVSIISLVGKMTNLGLKLTPDYHFRPRTFFLTKLDFKHVDSACCGIGRLNAEQTCNISASLCRKRSEYWFWDRNHPTQAASHLVAMTLYGGEQRFVSPINFSQLAADMPGNWYAEESRKLIPV